MRHLSFALLPLIVLLSPTRGFGQIPAAASPVVRPVHLTFCYFRDVADQKFPDRPVQTSLVRDPKTGRQRYSFFDRRTNQTFRDGAQIQADVTRLTAQPQTAEARARLRQLRRERRRWRAFLRTSPVVLTEADLKPTCAVTTAPNGTPAISQTFTAQGTGKFARYTTTHVGEIMGIVAGDRVLSAPLVNEPITDSQAQISGGLGSLAEAKALADGMNAAARQARKP